MWDTYCIKNDQNHLPQVLHCLFGFVEPTLCTTSTLQSYVVHHRRVIRRKPSNMPQILTNVHCKHYRLFKVNQSKLSVVQCWSHIIVLINVVQSWLIHMPSMQQKNVDQLVHLDQPIIGSRLINFNQHLQCVINIDQSLTNFDQLWLTLINLKCLECTNLVRIWGIFMFLTDFTKSRDKIETSVPFIYI